MIRIEYLSTLALAVLLGGCADEPAMSRLHPKTKWVHTVTFLETFDKCIDVTTGKIIIETMHATGEKSDSYSVFQNGAGYGDFETAEQAKASAIRRSPECAEGPP